MARPGSIELTSAWSVYAGFQHYWNPNLRTSLYGGYLALEYNANATALICGDLLACPHGGLNADWQCFRSARAPCLTRSPTSI